MSRSTAEPDPLDRPDEGRGVRHGTIVVERRMEAPASRIFAAFADLDVRRNWYHGPADPGTGHHELDLRVGGEESSGGTYAGTGLDGGSEQVEYRSRFMDVEPDGRIIHAYELVVDGQRRSTSLVTIELLPDEDGTRLLCTEQYALLQPEDVGPDAADELQGGLRLLLRTLASVVEDSAD